MSRRRSRGLTLPEGTRSLAVACIDRHPVANSWVHWLVINIPTSVKVLPEGASRTTMLPAGAKELENTFGTTGWEGPLPPRGSGTHPYEFQLCALSVQNLNLACKHEPGFIQQSYRRQSASDR